MKEEIKRVLQTMKDSFGEAVFSNPSQFNSALTDVPILENAVKIRNLLRYAICNVLAYEKLKASINHNMQQTLEGLITELSTNYMIDALASRNVMEAIAELLGYKIDITLSFNTIFDASKGGTLEHVKYFIENKGINVDCKDDDGWTPLMHAARSNINLDVLKYLVSKGANVNIRSHSGRTLLHAAAQECKDLDIFRYLLSLGQNVNCRNNDGDTPLHDAASWNSNVEVIKFLVSNGAVVNAKGKGNRLPIHYAAASSKNVEVLKYLVSQGADIHAKKDDLWTPLHNACLSNENIEIIKYIISQGADVNAKDDHNATPLHMAACNNPNIEVLKVLLANGADVKAQAYADDGVSTFTPANAANTDEKRDLLWRAEPYENTQGSLDEELKKIEATIALLERELMDGTLSVESNLRRMRALATDELINRKIQEKDYVWIEQFKKDLMVASREDLGGFMNDLSMLLRKYPNDERIIRLGKRGLPVKIKMHEISQIQQNRLNAPMPPNIKKMIEDWIEQWKREFDY